MSESPQRSLRGVFLLVLPLVILLVPLGYSVVTSLFAQNPPPAEGFLSGLREIASVTGGSYTRSVAGDFDLDLLYFDGIRSKTVAATLKSGKIKVYEERFTLFLVAAFLLLLFEGLIGVVGRARR